MTAHATRMLLLGAVAMFEPVNGYQIRRELVSWQVDKWAHVNPGSIYHGLATLTRQGNLARTDLVDGTREVAVYELTEAGRAELDAMLVAGLETVDPYDRVAFQVAFGMLPLVPRPQVLRSLTVRRVALERAVADFVREREDPMNGPPHARRAWALWMDLAVAELAWLREAIEDVRSGALRFAPDEDWGWEPPPDDPGRQMTADRERYRSLLGRRP
jgi:DNA-binding PadR family transcriptional regulator